MAANPLPIPHSAFVFPVPSSLPKRPIKQPIKRGKLGGQRVEEPTIIDATTTLLIIKVEVSVVDGIVAER